MKQSDYVKIFVTAPETHADIIREAMGKAGAGIIGNYSYYSYSVKGIGRFKPEKNANPYIGKTGALEEVIEENIETVCHASLLEHVIEEIKKVHPYEETVIDIQPVYEIGRKKAEQK